MILFLKYVENNWKFNRLKSEPRAIFDDNLLERKIFDTKVFDMKVVRCEKYSTKAYK